MYGCELWSLTDNVINIFCTAWRRVLRRLLNLPYTAHCYLLPLLTDTLPAFDEICRRSAKFFLSCLNSKSSLVKAVAKHGVDHRRRHHIVRGARAPPILASGGGQGGAHFSYYETKTFSLYHEFFHDLILSRLVFIRQVDQDSGVKYI